MQGFGAQLGFRLPNMIISPFTRRHYVSHTPMDHTAVIKFVENRFIGSTAHLTARDAAQPEEERCGGLLPMAVFMTRNAPGLRTSPVKRGYWVVRRVLGETIPPPPATVPELPHDEAKLDLPLREVLAKHR